MLGVIGPNGAGKTTLFNLLSGVLRPTRARSLDGQDVTVTAGRTQRARAGLGRTFQTSNLFAGLTALENVRLAAQARLGGASACCAFPRRRTTSHRATLERLARSGSAATRETAGGRARPTATSASWRSRCCWPPTRR